MTMSAIGGCSPAQATQYTSTASTSTASTTAAGGAPRDGSTFISAIASALSDIGVTAPSADGAATTDPAQALGGFLQTLMQTLHAQNAGAQDDAAAAGSAPVQAHGHHGGKGGNMQADLKSLIASLGSTSADSTPSSATADLSSSFKNLLGSLGADGTDSGAKLGQFLQTLSSKLESSGPSGNLVNTTA
ncbi:MAG TPA: hypothetical protein VFS02_04735 [Telluria sp.]|nr:hypothetical protein [Telluria sp.]